MSPEQADMGNEDTDTRADIYSLGVVLYELLAGAPPFDHKVLEKLGFAEFQRILQEEEPPRPSLRFTALGEEAKEIAERRHTQVVALARRLHRELEWIPLKAMRKDRSRRYRSASELADDIQNYLNGAPLIAGPETAIYRVKKFVRKHAGSVVTVLLVAVAITLGFVISTTMYLRAEKARHNEAIARTRAEQAEKIAQEQRKLAEERAEDYRRSLYANRIALADASYREGNISRVRVLLDSCPEDLRGWEWYRLNHISDQSFMTVTLHGHTYPVCGMAVSPDGKRFVSGGYDKMVKVWDAGTGAELMTLRGHTGAIESVAFSPDGRRIVSGSRDKTIKVWDAATGAELMTLRGHKGGVVALFAPNGKRIVSASEDKTIRVWDAQTGEQVMTLRGHEAPLWCLNISPDGKRIVSGSKDKTIKVWDASTGTELMTLSGHEGYVSCAAFSPDGKRILSGSWDKTIKVWNAATGAELMTLAGHTRSVTCVAFSPNGKRILSGSRDKTIKMWDAATGTELMTLRGHKGTVKEIAVNADGEHIVSNSSDGEIKLWDLAIDRERMNMYAGDGVWRGRGFGFSPNGKRILSGSAEGMVTVWDRSSGTELMAFGRPEGDMVIDAQFTPNGKRIFSSQIRKGTIWDADTGAELMSFRGDRGYVNAAFSPDGKQIASWVTEYWDEGHDDNTIKLRDATTGAELMTLDGHESDIWDVVFSPDSKRLVSCGGRTIKVWNARTGKEVMTFSGHKNWVLSVAFSPDGARIASGGTHTDKTIKLWDADTGAELMTLRGHDGGIDSIAFSLDGKRIVSRSKKTVKLWDAATGAELMTLREPGRTVALSPDGKTIAIGTSSGITLLESEVPAGGYGPRRIGAAARKVVDELYEEHGFYHEVIEKLGTDNTLAEPVRRIALQIANARRWEDAEKLKKESSESASPEEAVVEQKTEKQVIIE